MGLGINKSMSGQIMPIALLIIALLSTGGIYFYNSYLQGENAILKTRIAEREAEMKEVKKDTNLQIFDLITTNQDTINRLKSHSQITSFITILDTIEKKYSIEFNGFNFANGVLSTEVSTLRENSIDAYRIISEFIHDYRNDENADFTLPFISQVSGSSQMKMKINLEVKEGFKKGGAVDSENAASDKQITDESLNLDVQESSQEKSTEAENGFSTQL